MTVHKHCQQQGLLDTDPAHLSGAVSPSVPRSYHDVTPRQPHATQYAGKADQANASHVLAVSKRL